jgi:ubiquinone biosynthesis monooxygenase Coq7
VVRRLAGHRHARGALRDRANLGFLAETERQVEAHLKSHLTRLPEQDLRSREIVEQMKVDEVAHAETALQLGGVELPGPVKAAMKASSKLMTGVAYWV